MSNPGGGVVVVDTNGRGPLAVAGTGASSAVALSATCTHRGCTVGYSAGAMALDCSCHGSRFALTGQVLQGPAGSPLQLFPAIVNSGDITVTGV